MNDQHVKTGCEKCACGSHAASKHWLQQRVTAVLLIVLGLWFVSMVLRLLHADFTTARSIVGRPWNALGLALFVIFSGWHAVLGLQVIIEDYVSSRSMQVVLRMLICLLALLGAMAGVLAVLRIVH